METYYLGLDTSSQWKITLLKHSGILPKQKNTFRHPVAIYNSIRPTIWLSLLHDFNPEAPIELIRNTTGDMCPNPHMTFRSRLLMNHLFVRGLSKSSSKWFVANKSQPFFCFLVEANPNVQHLQQGPRYEKTSTWVLTPFAQIIMIH